MDSQRRYGSALLACSSLDSSERKPIDLLVDIVDHLDHDGKFLSTGLDGHGRSRR